LAKKNNNIISEVFKALETIKGGKEVMQIILVKQKKIPSFLPEEIVLLSPVHRYKLEPYLAYLFFLGLG